MAQGKIKNKMRVSFFDSRIEKFIEQLNTPTREKVSHTIELLEQYGNLLGLPHSKKLRKDLYELRTQGKPAIRLMYAFYNQEALILHIFSKKIQKTPSYELAIAVKRLKLLQVK